MWCTLRMPDPGWAATALFMLVEERFVLTELRVVPAETSPPDQFGEWSRTPEGVNDPAGITMTLLQELRLGDLLEPISWVAKGLATAAPPEGEPPEMTAAWQQLAESSNPGRRPRSDAHFAAWASRISNATADPATRLRPIAAVADETGLRRAQVRDIAHEARRRKVLTDPPAGARGGGMLTQKGRDLLASKVEEEP